MKTGLKYFAVLTVLFLGVACSKDLYEPQPLEGEEQSVIATVLKGENGEAYLHLDEQFRFYPLRGQITWQGPRRVAASIVYGQEESENVWVGDIRWMDPLDQGEVSTAPSISAQDGLDVLDDWMTSVQDGFLTLHYETLWGDGNIGHRLALQTGVDPDDPYTLQLLHDRQGDPSLTSADALICFDINALPDTGDEYKVLTLKWTSSAGQPATKTFLFKTRP